MQSTTTLAADAAVIALRNAMQSAALYAGRCDSDEDAAHLLLTALTPLVERDDDAAITLPAAALQRLLEGWSTLCTASAPACAACTMPRPTCSRRCSHEPAHS